LQKVRALTQDAFTLNTPQNARWLRRIVAHFLKQTPRSFFVHDDDFFSFNAVKFLTRAKRGRIFKKII
jgi:hypothetical protein